jgi:hypothetical protein
VAVLGALFTLVVLGPIPVGAVVGYTRFSSKRLALFLGAIVMLAVGFISIWLSTEADNYAGRHFWEITFTATGFIVGGLGLGALGAWLALLLGMFGRVIAGALAIAAILVEAAFAMALLLHVSGFA